MRSNLCFPDVNSISESESYHPRDQLAQEFTRHVSPVVPVFCADSDEENNELSGEVTAADGLCGQPWFMPVARYQARDTAPGSAQGRHLLNRS
jgi:hypothetical protein